MFGEFAKFSMVCAVVCFILVVAFSFSLSRMKEADSWVSFKALFKLVLFLVTIVLFFLGIFLFRGYFSLQKMHYSIYRQKDFNQEVWFEEEKEYHPAPGVYGSLNCARGRMYDDLHKNHLKFLMSKKEIENLLGHSTVKRKYGWLYKYSDCFQYELGFCHQGPPSLLTFCRVPFFTSYRYYLVRQGDGGKAVYEDNEERQKIIDKLYNKGEKDE
ncbi:MAG: hypothetical protein COA94_08500 [Rickettsiales bacterium]|nr:MAG: hypothetical protein COA94_08500 [Rickettsiales bacterium]